MLGEPREVARLDDEESGIPRLASPQPGGPAGADHFAASAWIVPVDIERHVQRFRVTKENDLMTTEFSVSRLAHELVEIPSFSLRGKNVLITGGSRGIGRACALTLAAAGANVAVSSTFAGFDDLLGVCREIRALGRRAEAYSFDISVRDAVLAACDAVTRDFERIDVLVNNAGVTRDGSFRKMDRAAWDDVISTNLTSVFDVTRLFIDPMAERGWGRVINVSSIVGRVGNFGQANYAAAKAGLIGFTKTLAREYAKKGVTVNAVAPGFIKTRMLEGVSDKALKSVVDGTPVGRLGDPMEIGASVLYLASPAASFITGHVLDVNGGAAM
jgi:NAD(P)-dependent dehydrogenase (short-subunit alcohol dehydrogenase family)